MGFRSVYTLSKRISVNYTNESPCAPVGTEHDGHDRKLAKWHLQGLECDLEGVHRDDVKHGLDCTPARGTSMNDNGGEARRKKVRERQKLGLVWPEMKE